MNLDQEGAFDKKCSLSRNPNFIIKILQWMQQKCFKCDNFSFSKRLNIKRNNITVLDLAALLISAFYSPFLC